MTAAVLVVHAIDTEGPLGGNARRLPDGRAEFLDNWPAILDSLSELTADSFRDAHLDSFDRQYRFNWFVMDFTGFATNPKHRVAEYHDTWDNIHTLPVGIDGRYFHYHVPPASGAGDEWSDSWLSSNECNVILARRLIERGAFPAAFRAGGTIEDEAASAWLEETIPIDFSNRVSARSVPGADLYAFNWHGAPEQWGAYRPSRLSVLRPGGMHRWIYRSIDLVSRYNELTQEIVDACFADARRADAPVVLSYFSHDNRDMRPETYLAHELLACGAERSGVPWRSCTAVEAHRLYQGLPADPPSMRLRADGGGIHVVVDGEPFQRAPFVAAELADGRIVRLFARELESGTFRVAVDSNSLTRVGAAVTSAGGAVVVAVAAVANGSGEATGVPSAGTAS